MVHVIFLGLSLLAVALEHKLLLAMVVGVNNWKLRRGLQLLALAMPVGVLSLFCLTMLPALLAGLDVNRGATNPTEGVMEHQHHNDTAQWWQGLIGLVGFGLIATPVVFSLVLSLVKLIWLYLRTWRRTWRVGETLQDLATNNPILKKRTSSRVEVRVWYSSSFFAFNLPGLGPGIKSIVVVSSGLIEQLEETQLEAVVWHELAHLARQDFWWMWLAQWWRGAFFYLTDGSRFLSLLQREQELECDERVGRLGGLAITLALADALIKVWEFNLSVGASTRHGKSSTQKFQAPALAAQNLPPSLTEQRVSQLIELGSSQIGEALNNQHKTSPTHFSTLIWLGLSLMIWLAVTGLLHLVCPTL